VETSWCCFTQHAKKHSLSLHKMHSSVESASDYKFHLLLFVVHVLTPFRSAERGSCVVQKVRSRPLPVSFHTSRSNRALRIPSTKPPAVRSKFRLFIRHSFRSQASLVSSRNVSAVEHLLRKGRRQIEGLEAPAVKDVWISEEMHKSEIDQRAVKR
jgi:succinate dehydrogenase assembly factor 1